MVAGSTHLRLASPSTSSGARSASANSGEKGFAVTSGLSSPRYSRSSSARAGTHRGAGHVRCSSCSEISSGASTSVRQPAISVRTLRQEGGLRLRLLLKRGQRFSQPCPESRRAVFQQIQIFPQGTQRLLFPGMPCGSKHQFIVFYGNRHALPAPEPLGIGRCLLGEFRVFLQEAPHQWILCQLCGGKLLLPAGEARKVRLMPQGVDGLDAAFQLMKRRGLLCFQCVPCLTMLLPQIGQKALDRRCRSCSHAQPRQQPELCRQPCPFGGGKLLAGIEKAALRRVIPAHRRRKNAAQVAYIRRGGDVSSPGTPAPADVFLSTQARGAQTASSPPHAAMRSAPRAPSA